jgi:hypothetical protein
VGALHRRSSPYKLHARSSGLAAILLGGGERLNRETRFTRLSRIWTKHQRKVNRFKRIFGNSAVNIMRPSPRQLGCCLTHDFDDVSFVPDQSISSIDLLYPLRQNCRLLCDITLWILMDYEE